MKSDCQILYVEDNELHVKLLQRLFRRSEPTTTIRVAGTVSEALELYDEQRFDAVLIDWNLPDGDGIEVAVHVRKDSRTLPIVFLSSAISDSHLAKAAQFFPKACLNKDFRSNQIIELIGVK